MKLLIFHASLGSGGIESMIVNLANEMVNYCDVSVSTIFKPRETDICNKKLDRRVAKFTIGKTGGANPLNTIYKIYKFIRSGGYTDVHLNGFFYYYFIAIILLHKKVNFYYTVHNDAEQENVLWDKYLVKLKRFCFKHKWAYPVTISKQSQISFEKLYGAENRLIYNGVPCPNVKHVDISKYKKTPNTKVFLNPARISKQKNQLMLCLVVERLLEENFDCCLLIAGSNDEAEVYEEIKSHFSDRIVYIGERNDIINLMNTCSAMCLSSAWEGMPVTLLEALSVGCIPVCTPVGGICDVVDNNNNGILSDGIDEESYYQALKRFMMLDSENEQKMSANCKATFEKYDIKNTAREYYELFTTGK